jgi:hypothetical protein
MIEGIVLALFLGVPLVVVSLLAYLSWRRRRVFLSKLPSLAVAALERLAKDVLDEPSTAQSEADTDTVRVEGKRSGEDVRLRADFGPIVNQQYLANNMPGAIVTEMKVTVGLRGATPRFTIRAIEGAQVHFGEFGSPTVNDLEKAWVFEMDEKLASSVIDEEIGRQLMRLRESCPDVKSISADQSGLTITWTVPAGISRTAPPPIINFDKHAGGVTVATDVALSLQSRILDVLEERAHMRVVGMGYRGPEPIALDDRERDEDEDLQEQERAES